MFPFLSSRASIILFWLLYYRRPSPTSGVSLKSLFACLNLTYSLLLPYRTPGGKYWRRLWFRFLPRIWIGGLRIRSKHVWYEFSFDFVLLHKFFRDMWRDSPPPPEWIDKLTAEEVTQHLIDRNLQIIGFLPVLRARLRRYEEAIL